MKRAVLWVVGAGIASVGLVFALRAQEQKTSAPSAESPLPPATASETASGPEQVVFTFADETQMQQFAQVWQQRQGLMTRMAVLQAYWNQEQATLAQLNQQLLAQYNLDVNKNYTLDTARKVLIEQPATSEEGTLGDQAQVQPPSTPSSP